MKLGTLRMTWKEGSISAESGNRDDAVPGVARNSYNE